MYLLLHLEGGPESKQWVFFTEGDAAIVQAALDKSADRDPADWKLYKIEAPVEIMLKPKKPLFVL